MVVLALKSSGKVLGSGYRPGFVYVRSESHGEAKRSPANAGRRNQSEWSVIKSGVRDVLGKFLYDRTAATYDHSHHHGNLRAGADSGSCFLLSIGRVEN